MSRPLDRLRHHVTGAIERGEAEPIVEQRNHDVLAVMDVAHKELSRLGYDGVGEAAVAIANLIDQVRSATEALELAAMLERKPSADAASYLREEARRLRDALNAVI